VDQWNPRDKENQLEHSGVYLHQRQCFMQFRMRSGRWSHSTDIMHFGYLLMHKRFVQIYALVKIY